MKNETKSVRDTTLGELLEMRAKLNKALEDKIGREPASGFNIEMSSTRADQITFCCAYVEFGSGYGSVVSSIDTFDTPQEAFDYAMAEIDKVKVLTKQDKIKALQDKIKKLEEEQ